VKGPNDESQRSSRWSRSETLLRCGLTAIVALAVGCSSGQSDQAGQSTTTRSVEHGEQAATRAKKHPEGLADLETCTPESEWCTPQPAQIPAELRRSLRLPILKAGDRCPTTNGRFYANKLFGGIALGHGPVRPVVAVRNERDRAPALRGVLRFYPYYVDHKWHSLKTLWFASPGYDGPTLIRGRQLRGRHLTVFGEQPTIVDPLLRAGRTANGGINGFREWPGATYLRSAGCYAWQVDGLTFSNLIVFKAEFPQS
jgi:hypothetical protein